MLVKEVLPVSLQIADQIPVTVILKKMMVFFKRNERTEDKTLI